MDATDRICVRCSGLYRRVERVQLRTSFKWLDAEGRQCSASYCGPCFWPAHWDRKKKSPRHVTRSIDAVTYPSIEKGRKGERRVEDLLRSIGVTAEITLTSNKGADVTVGGRTRIEVKCAFRRSRRFVVGPVSPERRGDHYVAIVMPDGAVMIQEMAAHLAACNASGQRSL
jgi:hypothetical protein